MIVVTGADGFVGSALRDVLAQGRRPWRELVRDVARMPAASERVAVDVTDAAALAPALQDARAVIHLAGVAPGRMPARPDAEVAAMAALLAGLRGAPLERFVYLSATGASPRAAHAWLRAKGEAEELLRASGRPCTILRAGLVVGGDARLLVALLQLLRGNVKLRLPLLRGGRLYPIGVGDVAIALATALDHHRVVGRVVELGVAPALTLESLLLSIAQRIGARPDTSSWPLVGIPLADALAQVPGLGLDGAESLVSRFAIAELPELTEYQQVVPMPRKPFSEELRGFPWGPPPPRPGDPLPVIQPAEEGALPLFIPREESGGAGALPSHLAARLGRVDPFGRIDRSGDSSSAPKSGP